MVRRRTWRRYRWRLSLLSSTVWAFQSVLDVLAYFPFNNFNLTSPATNPAGWRGPYNCYGLLELRSEGWSAGCPSINAVIQQSGFIGLAGIKFYDSLLIGDRLDLCLLYTSDAAD